MAKQICQFEGGYVNDPSDVGGETKFGIAKRYHPDVDIKNLTIEDACKIYIEKYFSRTSGIRDRRMQFFITDCLVTGHKLCIIFVQILLNSLLSKKLELDGLVGPRTIEAVNSASDSDIRLMLNLTRKNASLISEIMGERMMRIQKAKGLKPVNYSRGWMNRIVKRCDYGLERRD